MTPRGELLVTLATVVETSRSLSASVEALAGRPVRAAEHELACLTALLPRGAVDGDDVEQICAAARQHLEQLVTLLDDAAAAAAEECGQIADALAADEEWRSGPRRDLSARSTAAAALGARLRGVAHSPG